MNETANNKTKFLFQFPMPLARVAGAQMSMLSLPELLIRAHLHCNLVPAPSHRLITGYRATIWQSQQPLPGQLGATAASVTLLKFSMKRRSCSCHFARVFVVVVFVIFVLFCFVFVLRKITVLLRDQEDKQPKSSIYFDSFY